MKVEFFESQFGTNFSLVPESIEEVSALARIVYNTKAGKPQIRFYFSDNPSLSVWMPKIKKQAQVLSIINNKSK